ncbi:MAG TPA: hypothetical protein VKA70_20755 [Blastocatellia bacterium]|nr:hypothetical protein [Blastocatellia bacterium]
MFPRLIKSGLVAVLIGAMASLAMAQGPLHKRVNYSINVSHYLRMGDYLLPPGGYVLYQVNQNDPNLFGLYQKNTAREPIAMIRTVRIDHSLNYPEKSLILRDMVECREPYQVLRGWTIPGEDGWEIVSVIAKNGKVLTRVK